MNMFNWLDKIIEAPAKKALPVLSFPAIQMMDINVLGLISDSDKQAECMRLVAANTDSYASVGLMDLSVEAECFGSKIRFSENEVPTVIGGIISTSDDAKKLQVPEVGSGRTGLYIEAVKKAKKLITDRPVFAGAIGPFSLTGRLMDVNEVMMFCYDEPETVHQVLEKATSFIINYCKAYKATGADGVVMAEPLAGLLSPSLAQEFSSAYVKKIVDEIQDENFIVIYHNCGGSVIKIMDSILSTGASAYHFGNAIKIQEALKIFPSDTIIMGNIDPASQFYGGTVESVREATLNLLNDCHTYPNFVISSGCDIPPMTKWENINSFFSAVKEFYSNK